MQDIIISSNIVYNVCVIVAIEFAERLCYFGIATSLIIYLTKVLHQDVKTSAKSANQWAGVTTLMPLVGGFLADSYLGRFRTVLLSSIIYLMVSCNLVSFNSASVIKRHYFQVLTYFLFTGFDSVDNV